MAVENLKSASITNADATPPVLNDAGILAGRMERSIGTKQASASASIGSTYRLCRVPSNAFVSQVLLSCDAFDTTGAADVGLYDINGGAVVDADFFGSAVVLTSALKNSDVTFESGVYGVEKVEQRVWEVLGLSADPHKEYDVALTLTAANGAGNAADVTLEVRYAR